MVVSAPFPHPDSKSPGLQAKGSSRIRTLLACGLCHPPSRRCLALLCSFSPGPFGRTAALSPRTPVTEELGGNSNSGLPPRRPILSFRHRSPRGTKVQKAEE